MELCNIPESIQAYLFNHCSDISTICSLLLTCKRIRSLLLKELVFLPIFSYYSFVKNFKKLRVKHITIKDEDDISNISLGNIHCEYFTTSIDNYVNVIPSVWSMVLKYKCPITLVLNMPNDRRFTFSAEFSLKRITITHFSADRAFDKFSDILDTLSLICVNISVYFSLNVGYYSLVKLNTLIKSNIHNESHFKDQTVRFVISDSSTWKAGKSGLFPVSFYDRLIEWIMGNGVNAVYLHLDYDDDDTIREKYLLNLARIFSRYKDYGYIDITFRSDLSLDKWERIMFPYRNSTSVIKLEKPREYCLFLMLD